MEITKIGSTPSVLGVPDSGSRQTLKEATQEFESLFVAQVMKAMRRTVPESHLMGSGSGQQIFREMLDQELSHQVAVSGGFGLGEMLYRQLGGKESPTAPVPADPARNHPGGEPLPYISSPAMIPASRRQDHEN